MSSSIPSQNRVIDPFSSYNSNAVNEITQIVTRGIDGLLTTNSLQVSLDSTNPTTAVVVSTGYVVKDDVLINITEEHQVDFLDIDQYINTDPYPQSGLNYIVLKYTYVKSRPAPQASIKILKPNERLFLYSDNSYFLLKVVNITGGLITDIYDKDPEDMAFPNSERKYIKYYAGSEVEIPTFDQTTDQSRIAYESNRDKFYFGYKTGWGELSAGGVSIDVNTDSTGIVVGSLCYVDDNRNAIPALADDPLKGADLAVLSIGTALEGTGRASIAGFVEEVPVESGIGIDIGDALFLSQTDPGTVTNVRTFPIFQRVGRALSAGSSTTPINIIFSPKVMLSLNIEGQIDTWSDHGDGTYYHNVDVSSLDGTNAYVCSWFDNGTHKEIVPADVEIRADGNIVRVYITDSTSVIDYLIVSGSSSGGTGGGGGSGGSGTIYHDLLENLDYASSAHTGFAPDDHTHVFADLHNYNDIPSGEIILFESDISVIGYTLQVDQDDGIVYFTKGSVAGGEPGGTAKSGGTWSQPAHSHVINTDGDHAHIAPNHRHTGPSHTHTGPSHSHPAGNHIHQWFDLVVTGQSYLYNSSGTPFQIPAGYETIIPGLVTGWPSEGAAMPKLALDAYTAPATGNTGLGGTGATGADGTGNTGWGGETGTTSEGDHDHGGATEDGATDLGWRPKGRNYTRQKRI